MEPSPLPKRLLGLGEFAGSLVELPPPVPARQTIAHTNPLHCGISGPSMSALGHVLTAPPWQELSDVFAALVGRGHVSGLFVRR
jgi:hypothetical protein